MRREDENSMNRIMAAEVNGRGCAVKDDRRSNGET